MDSNHYLVKVKVKGVKNAGTDDPMYIVIFGPNGSSGKLRMNTKADDFGTGKTSVFKFDCKNPDVTDVGLPYAIGLCKTKDDGIYIEKVDVEYHQGNETTTVKFPAEIKLGEKGDFQLPKDRLFVTSYADNLRKQIKGEFNEKIKDLWVVIDNRKGTSSYENTAYSVRLSLSSDTIHHDSDSGKTQVKAFYTPEAKIVGNSARFELEGSFSKEYVASDAKEYLQEVEVLLSLDINCQAGILLFQKFDVQALYAFDAFEIGSCQLNIRTKKPTPQVIATSVKEVEYIFGENLSAEHKAIYDAVFDSPFRIDESEGLTIRNT
ncbi:MAG: hypothetical protein A3D31_00080 [Candidatus Fluviicola riflensis]|nr:MAG: hypothetical protein CHH17_05465 [Candidatus Fluviicola riflensis]OGS76009.1 MAG: hypothetical protein A3D31_00080 [Candidatus Fluviicola riflensis]OGS81909.1 MAG: hypothetical protein A2724_15835 [Fluviicola sp. RIFCSPHIGHO2_01_FULL_43_53]OGS83347.1 MAG: hypothetical protein A3E30_19000 [Fluviicola sp. RIFCSPHIGHO2_12_FULL_43_24]